jgi:hypothetical protein
MSLDEHEVSGHDFSRAEKGPKIIGALAPAETAEGAAAFRPLKPPSHKTGFSRGPFVGYPALRLFSGEGWDSTNPGAAVSM